MARVATTLRDDKMGRRRRMGGGDVAVLGLLVAGALVMVFPLYWMFATAVRPRKELFSGDFDLLPSQLVWSNFSESWGKLPFTQFYITPSPSPSSRSS